MDYYKYSMQEHFKRIKHYILLKYKNKRYFFLLL